jgi:hypothetical protein
MKKAKEDLELANEATYKMKKAWENAEQKAKIAQEATQKMEEAREKLQNRRSTPMQLGSR